MAFIPYKDAAKAAATVSPAAYQYSSIAPYANNSGGVSAAAGTRGYQSAASNQSYANNYDSQKAIADSMATIKALQSQIAAQPRLPSYNTAQAWAQAQARAESAVNPVYTDKLNSYLAKAQLARQQAQTGRDVNVKGIESDLTQNLEDINTTRNRAGQDTATTLEDLAASEAFDQRTGGTAFDRARNALLEGVADAGLTTSGLGAQQESNAIQDRNIQEAEMGRQYQGKEDAANRGLKRTNEDLDINAIRSRGAATTRTESEDRNLKNFIDSSALEENDFRTSNELERLSAVSGSQQNEYKIGVANYIQSLIGSGARAQDIALAQQIYG